MEHATRQRFGSAASGAAGEAGARELDALLDGLGRRICDAATAMPLERLMATLPRALGASSQAGPALLDLVATDVFDAPEGLASKLAVVDCILTLLCTDGDPHGRVAPRDPVTLTPVMEYLCSRAEAECHERLSELEADFFNAANLAVDVQEAEGLSSLRMRKTRLGLGYFAPGMLRAIITYNMALQQSRKPWVCEVSEEDAEIFGAPAAAGSVFSSPGLRALLAAVKCAVAREADRGGVATRVARALPLDALEASERVALRDGSLDSSDLACSILLLGLLSRTGETLAIDLQEIGIDPDRVAGAWSEEVDQLVRLEVNDAIMGAQAGTAYQAAQRLSALRDRWLYATVQSARREARESAPPPQPQPRAAAPAQTESEVRRVRAEARRLAGEAVAGELPLQKRMPDWLQLPALPPRGVAAAVVVGLLCIALGLQTFGVIDLLGRNLDSLSREELAEVSEYLVQGQRNGDGEGPAFVGTVDGTWLSLPPAERRHTGLAIVLSLRARGVQQVMIYDESRNLRIQGLGDSFEVL